MGEFSLIYHWASESAFKIFTRWGTVTLALSTALADSGAVGGEGGDRKSEEKDYFRERPSWEESQGDSLWAGAAHIGGWLWWCQKERGGMEAEVPMGVGRPLWVSDFVTLCPPSLMTLHLEISVWSKRGLEEKSASRLSGSCKGAMGGVAS